MRVQLLRAGAGAMATSFLLPWGSLLQFGYDFEGQVTRFDLHGDWPVAVIGVLLAVLSMRLSMKARVATALLAVIGLLESLPAGVVLLASASPEYAEAHVRVGVGAPLCLAGALLALGAALWPERSPSPPSPSLASGTC